MSAFSYAYENAASTLGALLSALGWLGLAIGAFLLVNYFIQRWKARHGYFGRGTKIEKSVRFYNQLLLSDAVFRLYVCNIEKRLRFLADLKSLTVITFKNLDYMIFEPILLAMDFGDEIWLIRSSHISFSGLIKALGEKLQIDEQALREAQLSFDATCLRIWSQAD